jgi:hypothetical protein
MPKISSLLAVGVLAASISAPSLAAGGERTVTKSYTITRGQIHVSSGEADLWMGTQAEFFRPRAGEHRVTFSLTDTTGRPVLGHVEMEGGVTEFCSTTPSPIRVTPGEEIAVHAIFGPCADSFSTVTEGTITATFSK